MSGRNKAEVAAIAKKRMTELEMTVRQLADAAGVDHNTVRDFMAGIRKPIPENRVKLTAALQWKPGGLDSLYDGGQPVALEAPPVPPLRSVPDDELLAEVAWRLRRSAASGKMDDVIDRGLSGVNNGGQSGEDEHGFGVAP